MVSTNIDISFFPILLVVVETYVVFVLDVVMLKRVSDVKSAGPEDNITGCRAFLIQDTYNDDVNVTIILYILLVSRI